MTVGERIKRRREELGLTHCFEKVCGAGNDGVSRHSKEQVINYAKEFGAEDCIMIGDRKFDIDGAHKCKIDSILSLLRIIDA